MSLLAPSPAVHSETNRHLCLSYIALSESVEVGEIYSYNPAQLFLLNTNVSFTNEQLSVLESALIFLMLVNLFKVPS